MADWSPAFWKAATERAVSTFAQSLVALLGADGLGLLDVDWGDTLSAAGLALILAYAKAVAANNVGPNGPSLANERLTYSTAPDFPGRRDRLS